MKTMETRDKQKTLLAGLLIFVLIGVRLTTQAQTTQSVLTWNVSYSRQIGGQTQNFSKLFEFSLETLKEFYWCLCNTNNRKCRAYAGDDNVVSETNHEDIEDKGSKYSHRYECNLNSQGVYAICDRLDETDVNCSSIVGCSSFRLINQNVSCDFEPVEITWKSGYVTEIIPNDTVIDVTQCESGCLVTAPEAGIATTTSSSVSKSTIPVDATTILNQDTDDEDNTTIIIAVVVSFLAVLIVAVIIGVVMWRRKRNAAARATRYATKDNTGSNGNPANPAPTRGGSASNATDLHNYSLATIDREGKSPGNMGSVSVSYAKVDLEKKHAARRSAPESTNNEEPQYSEYNSHQNYSEVGLPVPPYEGGHIATRAHGFNDNSTPKFKGNGKTAVNSADNGGSYSEIAINDTPHNDDEDDGIEPYRVSGAGVPSDKKHPHGEISQAGTNVDDPQYSFASDVKPGPGNVYSQLHDPVRNITNPYNDLMPEDGSANNNVETRPGHEYSRLHDPVRNINNPYNVLMADGDQLNNRTSV